MKRAYQLLRPFAYAGIKGDHLNGYRLYAPLAAALMSAVLYYVLPARPLLVGDKSAADLMAAFFVALPGFYIAALAAVVAFNGGDLDKDLPGVTVRMDVQGDVASVEITLRVFLSYLFAYLTMLSFVGFFICVGAQLLAPSFTQWLDATSGSAPGWPMLVMQLLFVGVVAFLGSSIVACTSQGLYFLAERVHQNLL